MLSGGQRQRVAMGRAIVRHPAVYLMDEPLSNLDAKLRVQMRAELKLLNRRLGVTTLYVTHDQVEAMTMGDRVAVLKPVGSTAESNLQQIDTPQMLYERPVNMFVAGFIGSPAMNFLRVRVTASDGNPVVEIAGTETRFPVPRGAGRARDALQDADGRELIMGVRPEGFVVVSPENAVINAEILVNEALGADSYVFFDIPSPLVSSGEAAVPDGLEQRVTRVTARVTPDAVPAHGSRLPLAFDSAKLHWFDPATGLAL
jgi:multiple sugar transport system ATP-binding protein